MWIQEIYLSHHRYSNCRCLGLKGCILKAFQRKQSLDKVAILLCTILVWQTFNTTLLIYFFWRESRKVDSVTSYEGTGSYPCRRLDMQPHVIETQVAALSHSLTVLMLTNGADVLRKKRQRLKLWFGFILCHTAEQAQQSLSLWA